MQTDALRVTQPTMS